MAKLCRDESSRVLLCRDDFTLVVVIVEVVVVDDFTSVVVIVEVVVVTCDLMGVCVVVKVSFSAGFVGVIVDISGTCCDSLSSFGP